MNKNQSNFYLIFSFGRDQKLKDIRPLTPGPGTYNHKPNLVKNQNPQIR